MSRIRLCYGVLLAAAAPLAAAAAVHTVQLENQGSIGPMAFEPAFLVVAPGDTVHFVPTDPGHDVETITGMLPAGAAPLKGPSGKPYDVTFTAPGLYGLRCGPHYAMGMVGVIVVGARPANLDQARAVNVPGLAKARMVALLDQAAAVGAKGRKAH